jgi:ubiquitin-activating enzyme E1
MRRLVNFFWEFVNPLIYSLVGADTTAKLIKMRVLIYGLRGVGAETCKNLALQGAGGITLVDTALIEPKDLGVNFFFTEKDIGLPRAQIVASRLKELNPLCSVHVAESLDTSIVQKHSALVITQFINFEELVTLNEFCRTHNISFFYNCISGVSSTIFVDHGPNHSVHDFDGERPIQKLITDIKAANENEILIRYDTPEGQQGIALSSGSFIEVTEVVGIDKINNHIFQVSRGEKDPVRTVRVNYQLPYGEHYLAGGVLTEKKLPTKHPMESLAVKAKNPGNPFNDPPNLVSTDLLNFGAELQLHLAWLATQRFASQQNKNHLPRMNNDEDANAVLELAKQLLAQKEQEGIQIDVDEINEEIILRYAKHSQIELQAISAFAGGVLAQEVVKCTGKFTPIPGFMHFSASETLPSEVPDDCSLKGRPQDELAMIFGWKFIEKLSKLKYFMVGCGALGCELLKNFALNGICCSSEGKLTVTDADRIELSNLSRQFLFREHNVGQPKSRAAGAMVQLMNPSFNIESLEQFVGPNTEEVFNDDFWASLDGVCNALDNMESRLYIDRCCVKYEKPLLESGTMGTKGNIDTVVPFKTRTYGEGVNAAESGGVPMCTLRNFPHITEHCIEWARDQFEFLFVSLGKTLESYLHDSQKFEAKLKQKASSEAGPALFDIRSLISFAKLVKTPSIGTAAQLSFDIFHYLFRDKILDLQAAFPKDYRVVDEKTKQDKGPFWNEKKRYPTVINFSSSDENHLNFLLSCTCLFSVMVGLIPPKKEDDDQWLKDYRSNEWVSNIAAGLKVPPYIQAPVSTDEVETKTTANTQSTDISHILDGLFHELSSVAAPTGVGSNPSSPVPVQLHKEFNFEPISFEKDDDLNFHINFVTSTTNLRCDNYSLKRTDFQNCKVISGRIIPAIATTTAAVCGLVTLELFKVVLGKDTDSYMNRAIGLGSFTYTSFTADPPNPFKTKIEMVAPEIDPSSKEDTQHMYDEGGNIKKEFFEQVVHRAYPENHSVWDKLQCSSSLTLKEFVQWFEEKHSLKLLNWNFIYGYKTVYDEDNKRKVVKGVSSPLYPPQVVLDYSLLPSLELSLAQASGEIMKNKAAKPTQQYIALWKECKGKGMVPPQPKLEEVITEMTTLKQVLFRMNSLAESSLAKGDIETKALSKIENRLFMVIPGSEAPMCVDINSGEEIEHLCAIKINLKE